ncbi:MAG: Glutamine--scyllo-inositol transaminase [Clostridia bacterium]|jgi:aminotransferase|nr:Glutamine--scyllo-inositol transaminase [Clostridia bacterium]
MISVFGSKAGKEEIEQVSESINNQWMGMGPKVKEFEEKFSKRLGLRNFLMVDSGSNGLYLAVKLLDLPMGSEIIVPSFTWVSCAQAVILAGHKPVFCDVDINSYNITEKTVANSITDKTKAIMVVHYAGLPVEMDSIKQFGLPIIEDAAHAVDSYYKGKACGSIGDVGVYSFDAIKNLAVGEGGGVTAQKSELIERARVLRYCGIGKSGFETSTQGKKRWWEYDIKEVFIKMNPSDILAGIGLAQLEKLDALQAYRKKIWDIYQNTFKDCDWIKTPCEASDGDKHSYFTYCIRIRKKRDELAKYLFEKGIYTTVRYHPLHMNKIYHSNVKLPNCEILNEEALNIPLHPNLSESDVEKIVDEIKSFKKYL